MEKNSPNRINREIITKYHNLKVDVERFHSHCLMKALYCQNQSRAGVDEQEGQRRNEANEATANPPKFVCSKYSNIYIDYRKFRRLYKRLYGLRFSFLKISKEFTIVPSSHLYRIEIIRG